jgi:hypothetical protein
VLETEPVTNTADLLPSASLLIANAYSGVKHFSSFGEFGGPPNGYLMSSPVSTPKLGDV